MKELSPETIDVDSDFHDLDHLTPIQDRMALVVLAQEINAQRIVEIGSWVGMTSIALAKGTDAHITCVDHFMGNDGDRLREIAQHFTPDHIHSVFLANTRRWPQRIQLYRGDSSQMAQQFPESYFDMVFIDASHDFLSVTDDILAWERRVRVGGIIAGHDYVAFPEVKRAVDGLFRSVQNIVDVWWTVRQGDPE